MTIFRPQSICLLLVIICMAVAGFTNIWHKAADNQTAEFTLMSLSHTQGNNIVMSQNTLYLVGLAVAIVAVSVASLLSYNNRMRQMMLGVVNSILIAILAGFIIYFIFKIGVPLFNVEQEGNRGIGFYAVAVAFFANWFSNRLIRRDEMLVRSADRMR